MAHRFKWNGKHVWVGYATRDIKPPTKKGRREVELTLHLFISDDYIFPNSCNKDSRVTCAEDVYKRMREIRNTPSQSN